MAILRTWGRVDGVWTEVTTDANGYNDQVYLTTLIQTLKMNLGESPFYGNRGIPAFKSIVQQIFPDFYVTYTQQLFAQYFASLTIVKENNPTPTYNISVITNNGAKILAQVPV
jgi:hypothetical protein